MIQLWMLSKIIVCDYAQVTATLNKQQQQQWNNSLIIFSGGFASPRCDASSSNKTLVSAHLPDNYTIQDDGANNAATVSYKSCYYCCHSEPLFGFRARCAPRV